MRSRGLRVAGFLCLLVGGANVVFGLTGAPWLTLGGGLLGVIFLMASLVVIRSENPLPATHDLAREQRVVRVVAVALAAFGVVAALVAVLVAQGEAQGHAVGHLLTGIVSLGLFAALAFPWHPAAGTSLAGVRGLVLILLVAATFGSFLESLGGSGFDAANEGTRISALATLHDIALPFGALVMAAVPLGLLTGVVALITRSSQRRKPAQV
jgi:hypothetical protein